MQTKKNSKLETKTEKSLVKILWNGEPLISLAGKLLLTLYLYLISYFYSLSVPFSWTSLPRFILIYLAVHVLCRVIGNIKLRFLDEPKKMDLKFGGLIFLLTAGVMGVYYAAYYPGGVIIDSFNQWYQVQNGTYVDWHPVIHTLLFMKLPSLICNHIGFVNFLQVVWIGLSCAYLGMVMERWGIRKVLCAVSICLGIAAPASSIVHSFCWKDTAMTIFAIVLAGLTMQIVCSKGEWLRNKGHVLVFALIGALTALMRHNGILLVGPLMVLVVLIYWKQLRYYALAAGILTALFMAGIKVPVYHVLNVQSHSQVSAETLGLPMTILANVLVHEPEQLDPACREFLYRIGSQELWESTYKEGNWNSAKWMGEDISNDVIEEVGTKNVLLYTWHAVKKCPYYAYRAVVKLFEVVWKPLGGKVEWSYAVNLQSGNGYEMSGIPLLKNFLNMVRNWSVKGGILFTWSWHIGFYILLMLFAGVSQLKKGFSKCLYWVPAMCYNFGTALLLCGPDFRFFAFNTVVTFPLLLMIVGDRE